MDLTKFAEELKVLAKNDFIPYYITDVELIELLHKEDIDNANYSIGCNYKCINSIDLPIFIL